MNYQELKDSGYQGLDTVKSDINNSYISHRILKQLENEYEYFIKSLENK